MRKVIIAAAAVVALAVVGTVGYLVGSDATRSRERAPKDKEVTDTLPASEPTTTLAPEPKDKEIAAGATQTYRDEFSQVRMTVFRVRDLGPLASIGFESGPERRGLAIEVRGTVVSSSEPVDFGWQPWSLGDEAGHTWPAAQVEATQPFEEPLYPDGKATPVGASRRGWITFELPPKARPTFIEYAPGLGSGVLKWKIPR